MCFILFMTNLNEIKNYFSYSTDFAWDHILFKDLRMQPVMHGSLHLM